MTDTALYEFRTKLFTKPYVRRWPKSHVGSWMWKGNMPVTLKMFNGHGVQVEGYQCYYNPRRLPVVIKGEADACQKEERHTPSLPQT